MMLPLWTMWGELICHEKTIHFMTVLVPAEGHKCDLFCLQAVAWRCPERERPHCRSAVPCWHKERPECESFCCLNRTFLWIKSSIVQSLSTGSNLRNVAPLVLSKHSSEVDFSKTLLTLLRGGKYRASVYVLSKKKPKAAEFKNMWNRKKHQILEVGFLSRVAAQCGVQLSSMMSAWCV